MIPIRELSAEDYGMLADVLSAAGAGSASPETLRADDENAGPRAPRRWLATALSGGRVLATLRPRPDGRGVADWLTSNGDDTAIRASLTPIDVAARQMALRSVISSVQADDRLRSKALSEAGYRPISRTAVLSLNPGDVSLALTKRIDRAAAYAARHGVMVRSMAELADDPDRDRRVCALDNALRQAVTGTDGWEWTLEAFVDETYTPGFDPERYFIALNREGAYVGLLRLWMNPGGPKLGLIAVARSHRPLGAAAALVDRAIRSWPSAEIRAIHATADAEDHGTMKLAERIGFQTIRMVTEMEKPVA